MDSCNFNMAASYFCIKEIFHGTLIVLILSQLNRRMFILEALPFCFVLFVVTYFYLYLDNGEVGQEVNKFGMKWANMISKWYKNGNESKPKWQKQTNL